MNRPEDAAIEFQTAWNAHDMAALGSLYHADATFGDGAAVVHFWSRR
jgi:hypothetical protein